MKQIPTIRILSVIKSKDKSTTIDFQLSENFISFYKKETGRKKINKEELNLYILNVLDDYALEKELNRQKNKDEEQ